LPLSRRCTARGDTPAGASEAIRRIKQFHPTEQGKSKRPKLLVGELCRPERRIAAADNLQTDFNNSHLLEEDVMATPVLFTVELFPWTELQGTLLEDSVKDFNAELREFFEDRAQVLDIPHDMSNLIETNTAIGTKTDNVPYVTATVVVGFANITQDDAKPLAEQFKTEKFNHVSAEVLDPKDHLPPPTG
jgi:hypothetical protein